MINISELNNPNYDLASLTQLVFNQYYLEPFKISSNYPRDEKYFAITDPAISRCTHGAMHAARVTAYIKVLHLFRQEYDDLAVYDLAHFAHIYQLSLVQMIHLVQIAGLFHDVARQDEGPDHWDSDSAEICLSFLRTSIESLPDNIAQLIANTIAYKDNPTEFWVATQALGFTDEHQIPCDYLRQLIHDADCLDIMRVRKKFKLQYLELMNSVCLQYVKDEIVALVKDIRQLINQQGDQYFDCLIVEHDSQVANFNINIKCNYEHAENVYHKITGDFINYVNLARFHLPLQNELQIEKAIYPFHHKLIQQIQEAMITASIISQRVEASNIECRDYLVINFTTPIIYCCQNGEQYSPHDIKALIYRGDSILNKTCNQALLHLNISVELGFNWFGIYEDVKNIQINGFSLKIIYPEPKQNLQNTALTIIANELQHANLMKHNQPIWIGVTNYITPERQQSTSQDCFFTRTRGVTQEARILTEVEDYIRQCIPPITALYKRDNEFSINPSYQNIEVISKELALDQKKIWLLRADLILAVGNKNSNWVYFGDTDLATSLGEEAHSYLNWEDRYGHPSLAVPHPGYDGSVYYGGYLAQRHDYLEIYTFSGRFFRQDLDEYQQAILEAYIVRQLQMAYGMQKVVFIDAVAFSKTILDNYELSFFLRNKPLPDYCNRRWYDHHKIESIFAEVCLESARANF